MLHGWRFVAVITRREPYFIWPSHATRHASSFLTATRVPRRSLGILSCGIFAPLCSRYTINLALTTESVNSSYPLSSNFFALRMASASASFNTANASPSSRSYFDNSPGPICNPSIRS